MIPVRTVLLVALLAGPLTTATAFGGADFPRPSPTHPHPPPPPICVDDHSSTLTCLPPSPRPLR